MSRRMIHRQIDDISHLYLCHCLSFSELNSIESTEFVPVLEIFYNICRRLFFIILIFKTAKNSLLQNL